MEKKKQVSYLEASVLLGNIGGGERLGDLLEGGAAGWAVRDRVRLAEPPHRLDADEAEHVALQGTTPGGEERKRK